jgi:hypothetical protein
MLDPTRLDPATLLGRPELPLDWSAARRELADARVLVTGAGGSVGARLAETLLELGPAHLTLLDHHDHALFGLRRRLDDLTRAVLDARVLLELLAAVGVEVVRRAAVLPEQAADAVGEAVARLALVDDQCAPARAAQDERCAQPRGPAADHDAIPSHCFRE